MKKFVLILLILKTFLTLEFAEEQNLALLDDTNFDSFITQYPKTVIFFYTPKCGPCEQFQPQVEKASIQMEEEGYQFAKFDGHTYKDISKNYDVTGYPSLLLFTEYGKKHEKFNGGKTYDAIQMWLYQLMNKGTVQLNSIEEIQKQIDSNEHMFIFFGKDSKDRVFRRYREFSYTNGDGNFFHTFVDQAQQKLQLNKHDQLVAYKKHGEEVINFQGKQLKINELTSFVETNIDPRMCQLTDKQKKRIFSKDRQGIIYFHDGSKKERYEFLEQFTKWYSFEDYVIFAQVTPDNEHWNYFNELVGLNKNEDLLLSLNKNGTLRYEFTQAYTRENLDNFIYDSRDDKLGRFYKSEDISNVQGSDLFEVLNSKKYHEEVHNGDQDYIVFFYDAKNEEHQEVLKSLYRVAKKVSHNKEIKFGISDASKNEYKDFEEKDLSSVTIRLYRGDRGKKEFKKFIIRGNKLQEDRMVQFLKEQSSKWVGLQDDL